MRLDRRMLCANTSNTGYSPGPHCRRATTSTTLIHSPLKDCGLTLASEGSAFWSSGPCVSDESIASPSFSGGKVAAVASAWGKMTH